MAELTREQIKQAMRHPYSEWTPQFVEQLCDMALRACDAPMTDRAELAEFLGLVAFGMSDRKTQDKLYEAASALSAEPETVNGLEIFSGEYVRLSDYRLLEEANKRLLDPEVTQLSAQQPVAWRHATNHGWVVTKTKHMDSQPLYASPPPAPAGDRPDGCNPHIDTKRARLAAARGRK